MSKDAEEISAAPLLRCSFCSKTQDEVRRLIVGPNAVYICDECVYLSLDIISHEGFNLRAAYLSFEFVAKLLYPLVWLAGELHITRNSK
jgi:hypothetical protein